MNNDFLDLLHRLTQNNVEFVVIGGFAAAMYGATMVTEDIDICCSFSPENLFRLQDALKDLHPVHRMTPNKIPLALTPQNAAEFKNLYLATDLGPLDCLSTVEGIGSYEQVSKASQRFETGDLILSVLSLNALIEAKKALNRPRDQEAVIQLKAIQQLNKLNP
ncbi:MAG: hypothetical protein JXB18_10650 [Sedimentisphaerales bacterium]|nr:hypothetical protein [Sedimentisphaerales bacterium]